MVAIALTTRGAAGQDRDKCLKFLQQKFPNDQPGNDPCNTLVVRLSAMAKPVTDAAASILQDDEVPVNKLFSQRDLQPRTPQQPSLAGSVAQGHALPGVQPAGVAAGTIAAVGTDAGNAAIAALALNPAILLIGDEVSRRLAEYSRLIDLTVFVPVTKIKEEPDETDDGDATLKYFGARLRVNIVGIGSGDKVWDGARLLAAKWIKSRAADADTIARVLTSAPDFNGCADALADNAAPGVVLTTCGAAVTFDVNAREADMLRGELQRVRRAADSRYFGADVRFDVGDPTMGAVENAKGTFLFAGVAAGKRFGGATGEGRSGVRARFGGRYAKLDGLDKAEVAVEGGLGFELVRPLEFEEINLAAALEFRTGGAPANETDRFQTDFLMLRGSFQVPITSGNSLTLNFGAPLVGDVSPTLSVNLNWGLLLSNALAR
jgi:hypothetical protein